MTWSLLVLERDVWTQPMLFESLVEMMVMVKRVREVVMVRKQWWRTKMYWVSV